MTLTQDDVQNKESRENKFLSEKIIQKAVNTGEVDSASVNEIKELFRDALSRNEGSSVRIRAEVLMSTLRNFIISQNKLQSLQNEIIPEAPEPDKINSQIIQTDNEDIYKEERELLQKIINEKIIAVNLSEQLREEAKKIVSKETQHIIGTGVNKCVIERTIIKILEVFKEEHKPKDRQQDNSGEKTKAKDEEENKAKDLPEDGNKKEKEDVSETEDDRTVQNSTDAPSAQNDSIKKENKPAEKKKLSLAEKVMQQAREDDIKSPLEPHTLHWPSSPVSFGSPSPKNSQLTDIIPPSGNAHTTDSVADERSLTQTKNQPKTQVIKNFTSKQTEASKQEAELKPEITEKEKVSPQATALPPHSSLQPSQDLSSASNTKMVFDGNLELDSSRIEAKHSVHKQNKELFDKYIAEQVDIVMEAITQNNDLPNDMLRGIESDLIKQAMNVSENNQISISERIQQLDTFFQEQKKEYATKKVDNGFDPKDLINDIIERSEKEVNTGDKDADNRFRETLRNTLSFKARHLVGSDKDPDYIHDALSEEYAKHRSFYTKNI